MQWLNPDEFQLTLDFFFSNHYLDEDRYLVYNYGSDMYRYFELKNDLFNNYKLFIINSSNKLIPIKENKSRDFELQLLGFIHRKLQPSFNSNYMHNGELFDYVYTMSDYFTSCIAKADEYRIEDLADDSLLNRRVKAFKSLSYFRRKLIDSKQPYRNEALGEFEYVLNKPDINFVTTAEVDKFNTMIEYLANEDYFLSNNIFEFKQRFKPAFSLSTKINSLYTILIKNFIITHVDDVKVTVRTNTRRKVKAIIAIKPIPNSNSTINLITLPNYNFSESFWENNTVKSASGKLPTSFTEDSLA